MNGIIISSFFFIFQKHQKTSAKKKLKRHDLSTNKEFLKSIPKTEIAKVILLLTVNSPVLLH